MMWPRRGGTLLTSSALAFCRWEGRGGLKQKADGGATRARHSEPTSFLGRHEEQMHRIEGEDGHGHQEEPA